MRGSGVLEVGLAISLKLYGLNVKKSSSLKSSILFPIFMAVPEDEPSHTAHFSRMAESMDHK